MDKFGLGLFAGFCITSILWIWGITEDTIFTAAYDAVAECEAELPRDQHCKWVITAEVVDE